MLTFDYHANRAYHAAHGAEDRDRAAEARHGGRYITNALARMAERHPEAFARLVAGDYPDAWLYHLSPSGSQGTGRDTTARLAQGYASGRNDPNTGFPPKPPRVTLTEAEAMFDWPIYRAAEASCNVCGGTRGEHDPDEPCGGGDTGIDR